MLCRPGRCGSKVDKLALEDLPPSHKIGPLSSEYAPRAKDYQPQSVQLLLSQNEGWFNSRIYRILRNSDHSLQCLFKREYTRSTRRHSSALTVRSSRINCRHHFFSVRACFTWNELPEAVMYCTNLCMFKDVLSHRMINLIFEHAYQCW